MNTPTPQLTDCFIKVMTKNISFPVSAISDICFAINQQCLLWKMQMFPLKRTSNQISFNQQDVCLGLLRVKQLQNLGSGALTTISEKKKIKDSPSTYNPLRMLRNWKYIFFGKKTITNNCQNLFTFEPSEIWRLFISGRAASKLAILVLKEWGSAGVRSQAVVSDCMGLVSSEGERFMICWESKGNTMSCDIPILYKLWLLFT